jgi:predicted ArsR family transcriptional regulator
MAGTPPREGDLFGPGLGEAQRLILLALKRRGPASRAELGAELDYAPATLRGHLEALVGRGLVARPGTRRSGPGRPEVVYTLADAGEALFPRRESALLTELVGFLEGRGERALLREFFAARIATRRPAALDRVRHLTGRRRMAEVARILSDEGFMAEIAPEGPEGKPGLRLCHCPIRDVVAVTDLPCRAEIAFAEALLDQTLARVEYIPAGGSACSYVPRAAPPSPRPATARRRRTEPE